MLKMMAVLLAIAALQACRPDPAPTAESRVLAAIADTAGLHARGWGYPYSDGPVMIDVGSFARQGRAAFGVPVTRRQLAASITPQRPTA